MIPKAAPTPSEIRLKDKGRLLVVSFPDGASYELPAELLRVESPSAEVQGHSPSEKRIVPGKKDVAILRIEPVGRYAVRLTFDDGHDSGIYAWDTFVSMGTNREGLFAAYLEALKARGLSR
ncbi:MAG TPA: DUF971 domain-containing protein [Beijerinckiaceae bacterium]|nr:DUF971 domain-containing protein [Beijerinckiaceae bacterium]